MKTDNSNIVVPESLDDADKWWRSLSDEEKTVFVGKRFMSLCDKKIIKEMYLYSHIGLYSKTQEVWVDLPGFDGYYKISTYGNFIGARKNSLIKQNISTWGYYLIILNRKLSKPKTVGAHKLVALTFIPNPENKKQVNHKDGNKLNNHVDNLEWCTPKENAIHASKTGLLKNKKGQDAHRSKLTLDCISEIFALKSKNRYTYKQIADMINEKFSIKTCESNIGVILRKESWK